MDFRSSNGTFCKQVKTQDKSHLGVRDLCTGCCSLKDLINSDKTGLDPILLPVLNLRVFYSCIFVDGTYSIHFLREKVDEEISYHCKRDRDRIIFLSMTPIRVYNPFCVIDFLSRFLS